ncbi:hypothetical protein [Streptomyces sp. NPDC058266]
MLQPLAERVIGEISRPRSEDRPSGDTGTGSLQCRDGDGRTALPNGWS